MLIRLVIEQTFGQTAARRNGNRGQFNYASVITDGVDAFDVGVLELINLDIAFVIGLNTGDRQVQVVGCGFTANRPDQVVNSDFSTIF